MQSAVFRWSVCIMAAIALIAVSCSSKKEEAKKEEVSTAAAKEEQDKELPSMVSSPPPTGQWKAVEEKSGGLPMVLTVNFENYSSAADVKAVAESAPQGDYKAKLKSFESHGGMQVGQQLTTQDGKTMVVGQFWSPQFVTARQLEDTWKITIVSGSPFIKKEKAKAEDVGFIELTVPVKGEGGTARLYMATQVTYEKGQLVPMAPDSKAKVLRVASFVPSDKEIPTGKHEISHPSIKEPEEATPGPVSIPERFQGTWFEVNEGAKLVISRDKVVWVKKVFDEMREEVHEAKAVKLSPDGHTLSFSSKRIYSRDVFFPKREHSAPVKVTLYREDASLRVTVGEMRIEEQPGVIVSHPGSTHVYRLSGDATP